MSTEQASDLPPAAPATRNKIRRLVLWLAIGSFVLSAIAAGLLVWSVFALGIGHVASASAFATALFLTSCGVVLYFMSMPPRRIGSGEEEGS